MRKKRVKKMRKEGKEKRRMGRGRKERIDK